MINEQELQKSINVHIANLMSEQIYRRVKEDLQTQWDTIVNELVSNRKTLRQTQEMLLQNQTLVEQLQTLVDTLQTRAEKTKKLQEKEDHLLSHLIKEFGMEE